ncbi:unnamed protein product (macronuclear) [Paramecium tetraurelia]|uniref:DOMON domain-containing protein n=1 Tax=Paramecium tetraurelia TaxID=5888 RepID=A0CFC8_PARTE|nr:uncharacterized protein GSPATT00037934001 [Paramecium tetraurelia]CAK69495.1 unnamed protein product [Paramecium tetraurelia]|eukprot:XP_001436892.1 hypothetical protein (macronuclear) [Paramecium tetraurelia strain d4-2]
MSQINTSIFILFSVLTTINAETAFSYSKNNNELYYNIVSDEALVVLAFSGQKDLREYLFCRVKDCECEERLAQGPKSHPKLSEQQIISNYFCENNSMKFLRPDTGFQPYIWKNNQQQEQPKHVEKYSRIIQEVTNTSGSTTYTDTDMTASLSIGTTFQVKWKFNTDDTIEMCFILNQKSWIGVGFGKGMKNVDMLTINIIDGQAEVLDLWSVEDDTPPTDTKQDLELVSYSISDTSVKARIKRKLNTGDSSQDVVLAKGSAYTWSYATSSALVMEDHGHNFEEFSITLNETGDTNCLCLL